MIRRVLMTADAVGGVWTYATELAAALGDAGVEVALATMGPEPRPEQRAHARSLANVRLFESTFALEWMPDPWEGVERAGEWLQRLEEEVEPDVVHVNGYAHGAVPFRAPVLVVAHSCVYSWWLSVKGEPPPQSWERYRRAVSAGLGGADRVAAPTAWMLDSIRRIYEIDLRGCVIPNGRSGWGLRPSWKDPLIFSAGRVWDEGKNIAALDACAERVPWPIYVAGDARHPGEGGRAEHPRLELLGALPPAGVRAWLSRAAIYALPARYEPFGLSALEAALSGCALVLGDIGSLREVWGDAALFVPPDDPEAVGGALARLCGSPDLFRDLSERARDRASSLSPERMAGGYLSLYREMRSACAS